MGRTDRAQGQGGPAPGAVPEALKLGALSVSLGWGQSDKWQCQASNPWAWPSVQETPI